MSQGCVVTERAHKYLVIIGLIVVGATLYLSQRAVQRFESALGVAAANTVQSATELRAVEQRAHYLEMASDNARREAQTQHPEVKDASQLQSRSYELMKLAQESVTVTQHLQEAALNHQQALSAQRDVLRSFTWRFWGTVIATLVGLLLTGSGAFFWYFQIKLIKDRREVARK